MSRGGWRRHGFRRLRRLCAAGFLALLALGGQGIWTPVIGSLSAARWFDAVPFVDPLATLEVLLASGTITRTALIGTGLLLVVGAVLGRVFCGWLCPLGLALELNADLSDLVRRLFRRTGWRRRRAVPHQALLPITDCKDVCDSQTNGVAGRCHGDGSTHDPRPASVPSSMRFWLLAACLVVSLVLSIPVFTAVSPVNAIAWAVVFGLWPALLVLALLGIVEWFLPRAFCRAICPVGAFYTLLGRRAALAIRIDPARAGKLLCGQCTLGCPMGIAVMEHYVMTGKPEVDDPSCTRCGACIDRCPGSVLRLGFRRRGKPATRGLAGFDEATVRKNAKPQGREDARRLAPADRARPVGDRKYRECEI